MPAGHQWSVYKACTVCKLACLYRFYNHLRGLTGPYPRVLALLFFRYFLDRFSDHLLVPFLAIFGTKKEAKMLPNALKNRVEKGHPKKEAQGSILEHFEELFGDFLDQKRFGSDLG